MTLSAVAKWIREKKWWILGALSLLFIVSFFMHGEVCEPTKHRYFESCTQHNFPYIAVHFLDLHNGTISAIAAVFIAGFTATLWLSTRAMQRITNDTLNELRLDFVATHRPKLEIRSVGYEERKTTGLPHGVVTFLIANTGKSDAIIEEASFLAWQPTPGEGRPAKPPYAKPEGNWPTEKIRDGDFVEWLHDGGDELWTIHSLAKDSHRATELYFVGYIVYTDTAEGEERGRYRMGFCRVFNGKRFGLDDRHDSDYEYEP